MNALGWEILQVLPEPIIFVDAEHAIQFMNPAASGLFEISDIDGVSGKAFNFLLGEKGLMTYDERVEFVKHHNEFATHPAPTPKPDDEQTWRGPYKDKYLHFHAIPIYDSNKNMGYVIRVDDATKEHSSSELLASLLSDMATPITSIKGYAEILSTKELSPKITEEQRIRIAKIIKEKALELVQVRDSIRESFSQSQ